MQPEPWRLTATEALAALRARRLSAVELLEACLARIAEREPAVHAWAHLDSGPARAHARQIDASLAAGEPVGALAGIPVGVKDIFNTIDMPTQMGSPIWDGFTPGNDARVVHALRMAGASIPGKTVTAEFAVHAPGPTANPHDPDYMAGTSSSGSAAAVADGMVPVALGTQTAGSIVRPASYCGAYGFKPSFGLVPRTGMLKTTDSLDTVGVLARSVDDLRLVFDVIRVHGADYPLAHAALSDAARQRRGARPWRIGVVRGPRWADAEPYAREALTALAAELGGHGELVVDAIELPASLDEAHAVHGTIYTKALAYYFTEEYEQHTLVSPVMYDIVERGRRISLDEYRAALARQEELAADLDAVLQRWDALLDLSTGGEALRGLDAVDRPDNCLVWTLCGTPAVSLPLLQGPNGLPFGAQLVARRYSDYLLLDCAAAVASASARPAELAA